MTGHRGGGGLVLALVACLTVAILLLGIELALVLKESDQLTPLGSLVLAAAAAVLYAAAAWRGALGGEPRLLLIWWVTMVGGHGGLGLLVGFFRATLVGAPFDAGSLLQWAAGISLPIGVLQAGYAIGISAVAYGSERPAVAAKPAPAPPAPRPAEPPREERPPVAEAGRAPVLEVYAAAINRLRADNPESLIRFATQAAKCEGGLLATRQGEVVAAVEVAGLQASRIAEALPKLMSDLERLGDPSRSAATMLHAAFGGYELLAAGGTRLVACLVGPQPGSREIAEVILPVLVTRAEALHSPPPDAERKAAP